MEIKVFVCDQMCSVAKLVAEDGAETWHHVDPSGRVEKSVVCEAGVSEARIDSGQVSLGAANRVRR